MSKRIVVSRIFEETVNSLQEAAKEKNIYCVDSLLEEYISKVDFYKQTIFFSTSACKYRRYNRAIVLSLIRFLSCRNHKIMIVKPVRSTYTSTKLPRFVLNALELVPGKTISEKICTLMYHFPPDNVRYSSISVYPETYELLWEVRKNYHLSISMTVNCFAVYYYMNKVIG